MMRFLWDRRRSLPLAVLAAFLCASPSQSLALPAPGRVVRALEPGKTPRIRVRLFEAASKVEVRGFDVRFFENAHSVAPAKGLTPSRALAHSSNRLTEWVFHCHDGRIRATPVAGGATLELREPVAISSPAGFLTVKQRPYREDVMLYSVGSFCEVVNEVDLEKYLDGLVNAEFSSSWNAEAVSAQVVAARTYALHQIRAARAEKRHYDLDSTIYDQVYDGTSKEDAKAARIVSRSRGMVLTVGSESAPVPLKAFYHSTCGGVTVLPQAVWGNPSPGFRRVVRCAYCSVSPVFRWKEEVTPEDVRRAFAAAIRRDSIPPEWPASAPRMIRGGRPMDVRVKSWDAYGRALALEVWWTDGRSVLQLPIAATRLREWVGAGRVKSLWFQVSSIEGSAAQGKRWRFEGRGNGHGVGMCQWGAKVMGERGFVASAILRHYYPDAILRKLW